jgi:hypothetical protein
LALPDGEPVPLPTHGDPIYVASPLQPQLITATGTRIVPFGEVGRYIRYMEKLSIVV